MGTRTFLIIPEKGGRIRAFHISLWIFFPLLVIVALGLLGIYGLKADWSPDEAQKKKTRELQEENRRLHEHHTFLSGQLRQLQKRLKRIRAQEMEIRKIAGFNPPVKEPVKRGGWFAFVSAPFQSRTAYSVDDLLEGARVTRTFYGRLMERIRKNPADFERIPALWPCDKGYRFISFGFGDRLNPFTNQVVPHLGVDFPAPAGTPVRATARGIVSEAQRHKFFGNRIRINHRNGFVTVYAHLNRIKVGRGRRVRKGQVIGTVGKTGFVTGPHLHYEVLFQDVHQDPEDYLFPLPESKEADL